MYVLADPEWVEDGSKRISITQIAMVRVDQIWQPEEAIYRRIRPMDASFHRWKHIAYAGGTREDFLSAPSRGKALTERISTVSHGCFFHCMTRSIISNGMMRDFL